MLDAFCDMRHLSPPASHAVHLGVPALHAATRQEVNHLGRTFFALLRSVLRAGELDGEGATLCVPSGPITNTLDSLTVSQAEVLSTMGLPYCIVTSRFFSGDDLVIPSAKQGRDAHPTKEPGWRIEMRDFLLDHWWTVRTWAQRDLAEAALLLGYTTPREVRAFAELTAADVRALSVASMPYLQLDAGAAMQLALLLNFADAAPDRVLTALAGRDLFARQAVSHLS